ncbi:hypothetical protein [Streptomyces sp. NBC_00878]|uniref:hypothetical protein n=1 Tax=Streptomyces sp. NBC_00878 TaxID=2975854 RepID=UPI002256178E|nr:hypothetical protein [Streptomyces sp. NBC_00878]MCX4903666.1 hypothetical protein [Streptomyces sp. NBC_00878]
MTETDRAVDDAERAREQGGGGRWFRLSPGRLPAGRLGNRRRLLPDELGVLVVLALLVAGIGIPYPDFLDSDNLLSTAHNSVCISLMACGRRPWRRPRPRGHRGREWVGAAGAIEPPPPTPHTSANRSPFSAFSTSSAGGVNRSP